MNNDPARNHRIKRVLERKTKLQKILLYYRLVWQLVVYRGHRAAARFFYSPRARVHWVGRHDRPRRIDKRLLAAACLSILGIWQRLDVFWSVVLGGALSLFLVFYGVYLAFPRKRAHWVR